MADLFLILSKTVWTIVKPETWIVLGLLAAMAAVWRGWRRVGLGLLGLLVAALCALAIWPLGDVVLRPLEARFPPAPDLPGPPAAILVLGGAEQAAQTARHGLPATGEGAERFLAAIALALRYPQAALVFTGGTGWFVAGEISGAEVARRIFTEAGIDPDRMILEDKSRTTWQNAVMTRDLVRDLPDGPVLLVTSAFHMPRSAGVFCAAGWGDLIGWPVDHRTAGLGGNWGWNLAVNLEDLNRGVKEWIGLAAYRATGRAAPYDLRGGEILCRTDAVRAG